MILATVSPSGGFGSWPPCVADNSMACRAGGKGAGGREGDPCAARPNSGLRAARTELGSRRGEIWGPTDQSGYAQRVRLGLAKPRKDAGNTSGRRADGGRATMAGGRGIGIAEGAGMVGCAGSSRRFGKGETQSSLEVASKFRLSVEIDSCTHGRRGRSQPAHKRSQTAYTVGASARNLPYTVGAALADLHTRSA